MRLPNKPQSTILTLVILVGLLIQSVLIASGQQAETDAPYRGFLPLVAGTGQTEQSATDEPVADATLKGEKTDQLIVRFRKAPNAGTADRAAQAATLSAAAGVSLKFRHEISGGAIVLKLPTRRSEAEVQAIANRLQQLPDVEVAQPDRIFKRQVTPNDPRYPDQWHYFAPTTNNYGVNMPAAWDITTGAAGVVVAVLDTGILNHADLATRTVAGYDFIADIETANDGNGRDADPSDPGDPCFGDPSSWHGTHVAGTIGARSNNNLGVTGINWTSKIQAVRVLGVCGGYFSDIVDAIRWSAGLSVPDVPNNATPAKVINMSLGGGGSCDPLLQSAITDAVNAGTVVAVAAGNSGDDASGYQPASCNGVITVGATNRTGGRAFYSNFGATVEISAPGGDTSSAAANGVLSTLNTGTNGPVADSYAYYQGTSMATPHVAGIVSLLFSIKPNLTPGQVLTIIQLSVTPFPSGSNCTTTSCGSGIINAAAALALAQNGFLPPSNLTALAVSSTQINLTWNDNSSDETNFQIQRCQGASCTNFSALATVGANVTSYNNTGLTAGTSYRYRVRSSKSGAQSAYSNIAGATTLGVGCNAYHSTDVPKSITDNTTVESTLAVPGSFAIGDVNVTNFRIQHTYDGDLTAHLVSPSNSSVELFSAVGGGSDNFDGTRFDDSAGQSIVDGSAPFVGAYRPEGVLATLNGQSGNGTWRLRIADNFSGDVGELRGWSLEICSVPLTLPVAPSALTSRTASSTQIALTWDDNSTNEAGFKIERCQNAGCTTFAQVATVGANMSSYTNGSLLANTQYQYRVRAYNGAGDTGYTNVTTAITGPRAPTALQGTVVSGSQINLAWTDNSTNELGFKVYRCIGSSCTNFVHIGTVAANATTYQSTGLAPGVTYRFRVRGYNNNGNSSYSSIIAQTTPASARSADVLAIAQDQLLTALVQGGAAATADDESSDLSIWTTAASTFSLSQGVACVDSVQPTAVTLLVGEEQLAMQAVAEESGLYTASVDAQKLRADKAYLLAVQWACDGTDEMLTNYVGTLNVAAAEGEAAIQRFQYLPLITQ